MRWVVFILKAIILCRTAIILFQPLVSLASSFEKQKLEPGWPAPLTCDGEDVKLNFAHEMGCNFVLRPVNFQVIKGMRQRTKR
jgi:hypothetical protein